ncbi:MAG TPA: TIGR04279 domain-containing protein [Methanosarcina sp.]
MKKKTGTEKVTYGRKWRSIWIILILAFLIISISITGANKNKDDQASNETSNLEQNTVNNYTNSSSENYIDSSSENYTGKSTNSSSENYTGKSTDKSAENYTGKSTNSSSENYTGKSTNSSSENYTGKSTNSSSENYTGKSTNSSSENYTGKSTDKSAENYTGKSTDISTDESTNESTYKDISDYINYIKSYLGNDTYVELGSVAENSKLSNTNKTAEYGTETDQTNTNKTTDQTNTNKTTDQTNTNKTTDQTNTNKTTGNGTETNQTNNIERNKSSGSNAKLKIVQSNSTESNKSAGSNATLKVKPVNGTETQNSTGSKTGTKIIACKCTKNQESVKPEIKICRGKTNLGSTEVNSEIKAYNWTYSLVNESVVSEIKSDESSWNNLKSVFSYLYPLCSFYTVNDSVKISYNGPETLGQRSVDIYLIKGRSLSLPENVTSSSMNEGKISLEDVINNNTESYIQIPATLNEDGDLSPMTLGPLPAGNYWVLINLAGNKTEMPESENKTLLAKSFEVLEYEMEAQAPYTVEEGKNFDVNMSLINAPTQKNYTYWSILIRKDACTTEEGTKPLWMTDGIRPIVNGVDIIKILETNLTKYESEDGKEKLKEEIQTTIGKENGTISIGEENQSNLSMESLGLASEDYILIAGANENDKGLVGIAQKKLEISTETSYGLDLGSSSGTLGSISSMKNRDTPFLGTKSILETPKAFISEELKPYIKTNEFVQAVRNPPKVPSFLIGFTGALLIGLAVWGKRDKNKK